MLNPPRVIVKWLCDWMVQLSALEHSFWHKWTLLLILSCTAALWVISPVSASPGTDWNNQGNSYYNAGRYEEALTAFTNAVSLEPGNAVYWNNRGNTLCQLGRNEEAIIAFNKAIDLDPNFVSAWNSKANALDSLNRYVEALAAYNTVIELDPNEAVVWNNKGNTLYRLGRYEEALTAFSKAIELDPNNAEAKRNKENVLLKLTPRATPAVTTATVQTPGQNIIPGSIDSNIIVGLILILCIGGGGYYVIQSRKSTVKPIVSSPPPTDIPGLRIRNFTGHGTNNLNSRIKKLKADQKEEVPVGIADDEPVMEKPLIFISSKSEDWVYAETLYNFLVSHGKTVFFAKKSLPNLGDAEYIREIHKAIDKAVHMIVVGSSVKNITGRWVEAEWNAFINEKLSGRKSGRSNLITLTKGEIEIGDLPLALRQYQVIPYDSENFETVLDYIPDLD
jgi:tetratricopeptide (TPR) repeat protein